MAHPHAQLRVSQGAWSEGATATLAERAKYSHYGEACRSHDILFLPISIDVDGALGHDSSRYLRLLAAHTALRRNYPLIGVYDLTRRLTFCLQGITALQVLTRRIWE